MYDQVKSDQAGAETTGQGAGMAKRCYYEVLEVDRAANDGERHDRDHQAKDAGLQRPVRLAGESFTAHTLSYFTHESNARFYMA